MAKGKQIYLTKQEEQALINCASEWCEIMGSGEETIRLVEERLNSGLGAALYKLYKGRKGAKVYEKFVKTINL